MDKERLRTRVLKIKNMVCPRCIKVVRDELESLGITAVEVELGKAVIEDNPSIDDEMIAVVLTRTGLELLQDKRDELVENIKRAIIQLIYQDKLPELKTNVSTYLANELGKDYATIATVFKASEGILLNRYIILQKIERVKELLTYEEFTLSIIATKLGYKSLQHLSNQFKEITGITPNAFRKEGGAIRFPIDSLH